MSEIVRHLMEIGEYLAAGFMEYPDGPLPLTYCRAYRRYYENCPIVYRMGAPLFPCGDTNDKGLAVATCYARQYTVNWNALEKKSPVAAVEFKKFAAKYHYAGEWNHSMLHYSRILAEGINRYEERLNALPESDFRTGLLDLIVGIRAYHRNALAFIAEKNAPSELIEALKRVPFSPATNVYEAMVSLNFMLSLDGWDNVGRIDKILAPYHNGEDIRPLLRCMMQSIQDNDRWSVTIGPDFNEISKQVLEASVGMARPLIQLRYKDDIPEEIWELAAKRILEGGGQPALYNEKVIQERLRRRIPNLTEEDAMEFSGGGCTETAFAGMSYTGATDLDINVLKIFEEYLYKALPTAKTFEEFYDGFMDCVRKKQKLQTDFINDTYNERAVTCFAPIRSLFTEDCIDKQTGWLQGGARYSFSNHSDSGIPNTIDSLLAVRHLVYEEKKYTPEEFLKLLSEEDPTFFAILKKCPCYGVEDERSDALAKDLTTRFYEYYKTAVLDIGIGFFPTVHQFRRHIGFGKCVGPTPDGRKRGTPLADSLAAVNGKATKGPTAMLNSASCYEQKDAYGMAVLNLSITQKYDPTVLRALVDGYFAMGGTQMQFTVTDREALLEARRDPDSHRDLIVRVGGYSEYFHKLTDDIKDAVIARTIFD
jgi:formate C-acetyltransferase